MRLKEVGIERGLRKLLSRVGLNSCLIRSKLLPSPASRLAEIIQVAYNRASYLEDQGHHKLLLERTEHIQC